LHENENRLFFLEDALPPEQLDHFKQIRAHSTVPIAMGELFTNIHECERPRCMFAAAAASTGYLYVYGIICRDNDVLIAGVAMRLTTNRGAGLELPCTIFRTATCGMCTGRYAANS
jgi:hypothetical protein